MVSVQAWRRKATVKALGIFFTGKPLSLPLESGDSYFRYKSNKLVFLFFSPVVQTTSKAINRKG